MLAGPASSTPALSVIPSKQHPCFVCDTLHLNPLLSLSLLFLSLSPSLSQHSRLERCLHAQALGMAENGMMDFDAYVATL